MMSNLKWMTGGVLAVLMTAGTMAEEGKAKPARRAISLLPKLGDLHHPVTTTNEMAQRFFDQGLTLIFGFNHDAAIRSFERALGYDPNCAMAKWGIGLALGPNINLPVSPEAEKAAYEAAQQAVEMSAGCTEAEKDYINALAVRYSIEPGVDLAALDRKYSEAMRGVWQKYPDDVDAGALYAESLMDLKPWQLWDAEGKPAEGTAHIVEVLEDVLRKEPNHPGANHYYIHAVEASTNPEKALPSAKRLETYAPSAGHLVHMPSHIYLRTGDYAAAAIRNEVASEVDLDYVQACGVSGVYPAMYTSHNMHFAAVAHLLQGKYAASKRYADRLLEHVKPVAAQSAEFESFLPTVEQVLVGFGRWEEILGLPEPQTKFKLHRGVWHYARGLAQATLGQDEEAGREQEALARLRAELGSEAGFGPFNKATEIFHIAIHQVAARRALVAGEPRKAVEMLREVVPVEDRLRYMEPPDWYLYTREMLGGALLTSGEYAEAEKVFREDLKRNHRKGRSLYGLQAALEKQGNRTAARMIERGFRKAWENADVPLEPVHIGWIQGNAVAAK